jgi:uncharacterized membrane-anchored protein YitT (DUF2179 family)
MAFISLNKKEKKFINNRIRNIIYVFLGVFSAAFGLKGFLMPGGFIDGGITGVSLLVYQLTDIPISILILIINIPFVYLAFINRLRWFAFKAMISITSLALCLLLPIPEVTNDKLLVAVFGGFFLGAGIGLSLRGGSVLDGTEIMALFITRIYNFTVGDFILIINIMIFLIAAVLLSIEVALYSILTYLAASKTVDFILDGIEEYSDISIISNYSDKIRQVIVVKFGLGYTVYKGKRGFGKRGISEDDVDIIYTLVTRLELTKLKNEIEMVDPDAFMIEHHVKDIKNGLIKKRALHWFRQTHTEVN